MMDKSIIVQKIKNILDDAAFKAACQADVRFALKKVVEHSHEESEPVTNLPDAVSQYLDDLDSNAVLFIVEKLPVLDDLDGDALYDILVEALGENVGEYVSERGWDGDAAERAHPFSCADAERQLARWRAEDEYLRHAYWRDAV